MSCGRQSISPGLRRLYSPYAHLVTALDAASPPELASLNRHLRALSRWPTTVDDIALSFVPPRSGDSLAYEERIRRYGEIPTRPGNWHDYFNALVWCVFPRAKAVINGRHCVAPASGGKGRGPLRDALTLFDECGVLVVSSDRGLLDALRAHRWREVFADAREEVLAGMRFFVFGHATLDALRAPFPGLCGKALYRQVPTDWFRLDQASVLAESDEWLSRWLGDESRRLSPSCFAPLPLLGIPQVIAANADADYYLDRGQFRPRRNPGLSGLCCV